MSIGKVISKAKERQVDGHRLHSFRNSDEFRNSSRLKSGFGNRILSIHLPLFDLRNLSAMENHHLPAPRNPPLTIFAP